MSSIMHAPRSGEPLVDISVAFGPGTPVWPGDVAFSCGWTARREQGSSVNLAAITSSTHAGTHADAPLHVDSSLPASESLPPDAFVGVCEVVRVPERTPHDAVIDVPLLEQLLARVLGAFRLERVLLCTGHGVANGTFPDAWPTLTVEAASWLARHGVRLVGTDAPSVDARDSKALPVHHALFSAGIYVLENLSLSHVTPGPYELLAQPLLVHGADAAPVRAMLRHT